MTTPKLQTSDAAVYLCCKMASGAVHRMGILPPCCVVYSCSIEPLHCLNPLLKPKSAILQVSRSSARTFLAAKSFNNFTFNFFIYSIFSKPYGRRPYRSDISCQKQSLEAFSPIDSLSICRLCCCAETGPMSHRACIQSGS